jgi:hypothetical protein
VLETDGTRTWDMRKSGSQAGEPAGHRLQPSYCLFSAPEGGEKTRLGGALRREEQLLPRAGLSTDRDGTDDNLSEGVFHLPFPPSSGTTGVAHEPRSGRFDSISSSWTALLISDPAAAGAGRVSWRLATFYISYCIKRKYRSKKNTWIRVCFRRYRHCHWRGWD